MNESRKLNFRKLPKALAELSHWNQFMKMSVLIAYLICMVMLGIDIYQVSKPASVMTLGPDGSLYEEVAPPDPKVEIERAVREYLKYRYNWTPQSIKEQVEKAKAFILPSTLKAYNGSMANVIQFSVEKGVEQRIYPVDVEVDLKKEVVALTGDRVTSIQGLKAAGDLRLELDFESGRRTEKNPWGVYISREKEL